jgi:enamine deaminase RidA (YjgF/YER057c/UK114 family)
VQRQDISSGRPWEARFSYSRAVRSGPLFQTSLTSPADANGRIVHLGDVRGQTLQCLTIIEGALREASMDWTHVVATRVYMLDTRQWEAAAQAHAERVTGCRPALSFIGVANFFDPDILVEVEVTAWRDDTR